MKPQGKEHAKGFYDQLILSGCESILVPREPDNASASGVQADEGESFSWDKESYIVFVPFVISEIGLSNGQHGYTLQVHPNVDVFITPQPKRGQTTIKQAISVTLKKARKAIKIPMVSGVSGQREGAFSFAPGYTIFEGVSHIFGSTVDAINATVQRIILNSDRSKEIALFRGSSTESPPAQTSIRANSARGRREKVRVEVLPENQAEDPPTLAKVNGPILGNGQGDREINF
jgi:hypothetical protein